MPTACCRRSRGCRRKARCITTCPGYTAKVAGTEKGVTEPSATFSTCFGAPFLPLNPNVYAKQLGERIAKHRSQRVAREHRVDRRPVRRRQPHEDCLYPRDDSRRAVRRSSISVQLPAAPGVQHRRADQLRRRAGAKCSIRAARGPTRRPTTRRRPSSRRCSSRTSRPSRRTSRQGSRTPARASDLHGMKIAGRGTIHGVPGSRFFI